MERHHTWIAIAAAITSSAWMVGHVMGEPLQTPEPPVIQLLAPVFNDSDEIEAPAPAPQFRNSAAANRPLGLGYPGTGAAPQRPPVRPRRTSEILPVQANDSGDQRLELPVVDRPDSDDPPPPSERVGRGSPLRDNTELHSEPERLVRPPREVFEAPTVPNMIRDFPSEMAGAAGLAPPYLPSNQDPDALPWTAEFEDRAARSPIHEEMDFPAGDLTQLPMGYVPWWIDELPNPIRRSQSMIAVDVDILVTGALQYSPQILGIRTQPDINNSILSAENAAFDWTAFVDSKWSDLNDPVGNTLTTGDNSNRFVDQIATVQAGLRRRNQYGGEFDISQKVGWQDNNSKFFVPAPQGTSRLQLNYTQPLLKGSGVAYNQARIVLAQVELNRSFDVVHEELQNHLVKVTETYWDLYRSRAIYLQRRKVYDSAQYILETLSGREEVDALQRQVNRARAAVASRRSEIVRAQAAIRNAESRLRLLVNSPEYLDLSVTELVPVEPPRTDHLPLSLAGSLQNALQYRPDISQAVHDLRSAGVRLGVSQNELLPKLDLVLNTYVAGLEGDHDILKSLGNQYSEGRPGYTVGTQFEMPLGNRAAKARQDRRQWELTKAVYDFRTVVETGLTDVELSVREAETSYREMLGKFQALIAAETESSYLEDRWRVLPGADRSTTLLLEDLLDAQQRLADAEGEFVQSQVSYSIALIRVRRAMGTLLIAENPGRYEMEVPSSPEPTLLPAETLIPPQAGLSKKQVPARPTGITKPEGVPSKNASSSIAEQSNSETPPKSRSWFRW